MPDPGNKPAGDPGYQAEGQQFASIVGTAIEQCLLPGQHFPLVRAKTELKDKWNCVLLSGFRRVT
jgi:hypothetical protein